METYHYIDKQTFSKIHFKLNLPVFTMFDNHVEFETKFIPRTNGDTIHTVLLECILVDAFNQTHSSGIKGIKLEDGKMQKIVIDIPFEKKMYLPKSRLQYVFVSSNGEKEIITYMIAQTKAVSFLQVERLSMSEEEKSIFTDAVSTVEKTESLEVDGEKTTESHVPLQLLDYVKSLNREVFYLKAKGGRQYKVTNGELLKSAKEGYYYMFELEDELYLADDAPIRIMVNSVSEAEGSVLLCEDFQILIVIDKDIGEKIQSAYIRVEPWKLLVAQIDCIERINSRDNFIATQLIDEGPRLSTKKPIENIDKGQTLAKAHVNRDDITVIWGPPGTGKTYTMADIAIQNISEGRKVLIVSHSNVSVDGVIQKVVKLLEERKQMQMVKSGAILRYGYVRDPKLSTNENATSFNFALSHSKELQRQLDLLILEKEDYKNGKSRDKSRIVDIEKQIKTIRRKIHAEETRYVKSAKLVGTTISKAIVDSVFENCQYDVVMFDEASMAYVTQIVCAAAMAKSKFICVGDFKQLPPISQEKDAQKVLNTNIFDYLGITNDKNEMYYHPWLVMLYEQRRMHPDISSFVNRRIYKRLLSDHPDMHKDHEMVVSANPLSGYAMNMIDIRGTYCAASKNSNNSRYNILSAILSFASGLTAERNFPLDANDKKTAGIITPYAAQAKLIKAMIQDEKTKHHTDMVCATVHQFQGSESDVIVFDAVESYPTAKAGFLLSKDVDNVKRLINVAVTRARGKFINLANGKFWTKEFEGQPHHTYYQLVQDLLERHNVVSVKEKKLQSYIQGLDTGKNIKLFLNQEACVEEFVQDVRKAKEHIIISIPDGELDYGAKAILTEMKNIARLGVSIFIKSKDCTNLPGDWKEFCVDSDNAHFPLISIDDKVLWYGLPIAEGGFRVGKWIFKTVCPVIARIQGENTVELIVSMSELSTVQKGTEKYALSLQHAVKGEKTVLKQQDSLASFIVKKQFCPDCKSHLVMTSGRSGRFYLKCSKTGCQHTEFLTTDMINHYIYMHNVTCPQDHGELTGRISQFGVYVRCNCGHNLKPDQI